MAKIQMRRIFRRREIRIRTVTNSYPGVDLSQNPIDEDRKKRWSFTAGDISGGERLKSRLFINPITKEREASFLSGWLPYFLPLIQTVHLVCWIKVINGLELAYWIHYKKSPFQLKRNPILNSFLIIYKANKFWIYILVPEITIRCSPKPSNPKPKRFKAPNTETKAQKHQPNPKLKP
ncbi:hypothetical protein V6Z12_D12G000700 [Gossypium hirsutum]